MPYGSIFGWLAVIALAASLQSSLDFRFPLAYRSSDEAWYPPFGFLLTFTNRSVQDTRLRLMPYQILCNGAQQKSPEARSGLALTPSRYIPLHNNRDGILRFLHTTQHTTVSLMNT